MILTTQKLVERAANDPAAFAELYKDCFPAVFHYIEFRCDDCALAQDLTARVFERVLRRLPAYHSNGEPFEAWLFAIARNTVTGWQRRERLRKGLLREAPDPEGTDDPTPGESAQPAGERRHLKAALAQLSGRERDLLGLRFASGLKNCEIAQLCGVGEDRAAVVVYRALRRLRALLCAGPEEPDGVPPEIARRVADLLDGFRPDGRHSPEESDFLALGERFAALKANPDERAGLLRRLPATSRAAPALPVPLRRIVRMGANVILIMAVLIALPRLIRSLSPAGQSMSPLDAQARRGRAAKPPALAPGVCRPENLSPFPGALAQGIGPEGSLSGGLLGGGELESGEFTFKIWLACDPLFRRGAKNSTYISEIDGLGLVLGWEYRGVDRDGRLAIYSGVEPFLRELDGVEPLGASAGSLDLAGLSLPDGVFPNWAAVDAPLRFALKMQLPDGSIAGATLNFILLREAGGFRPVDIHLEPLSEVELSEATATDLSEPPFPLLRAVDIYPDLRGIETVLAQREKELTAGAGWIHQVLRNYSAGGVDSAPQERNFLTENWLHVDHQGNVIAMISNVRADDGRLLEQVVIRDGRVHRRIAGESAPAAPVAFHADWGLFNELLRAARAEKTVTREEEIVNERPAWIFTIEDPIGQPAQENTGADAGQKVLREAVDAETGAVLYSELVLYLEGGKRISIWRQSVVAEERIDLPPDEVLALVNQPEDGSIPPTLINTHLPAGGIDLHAPLTLISAPGDDSYEPAFWYGDIFAGETFLGRVNFGATPGGRCARSASGALLAYKHEAMLSGRISSVTLNWLRLNDFQTIHVTAPALHVSSMLSWAPVEDRLAFVACVEGSACGLYLLEAETNVVRLLTEVEVSKWEPLWKPDGTQVAVIGSTSGMMVVVDVENGAIVYRGRFDLGAWQPPSRSPVNEWGVQFAREWDGGNCFGK